jgi:phage tail sheath protein FI
MPEYLAPGVYVEEVSFRAKSIEGVSTTTTGFVGPTRYGPVDIEPDIITSLGEFERVYGDRQMLKFDGLEPMHNYMWHGVRAFFENGGKRLYISRVFESISSSDDGYADAWLTSNGRAPRGRCRCAQNAAGARTLPRQHGCDAGAADAVAVAECAE